MRRIDMIAGRSINLSLSRRGLSGLEKAGLGHIVDDIVIPMPGRMIHSL
jgi:kynurenine 3-monooxygenase